MFDPKPIHDAIDSTEAAFAAAAESAVVSDARKTQFASALVTLRSTADLASIEEEG